MEKEALIIKPNIESGELEKPSLVVPETFRSRLFNRVVSYLPNFYTSQKEEIHDINTVKEVRVTYIMAGTFSGILGATAIGISTNLFGLEVTTPLDRIALMTYAFACMGGITGIVAYKKESKRVNEALSNSEVKEEVLTT